MKQVVIVIPVYTSPMPEEQASLRQCLKVLSQHDIVLLTHPDCDLSPYHAIGQQEKKSMFVELFDASCFTSVAAYNRLCCSEELYTRFEARYEYMMIYQLDGWVFSDQLLYWCNQGYDYIGAPLFYPYTQQSFTRVFRGIGNGGICLRRIRHCLDLLRANQDKNFLRPLPLIRMYWKFARYNEAFTRHPSRMLMILPTLIGKIFGIGNTLRFYRERQINEDLLFGSWAQDSWHCHAKLPTMAEAARFAFEVHPSYLLELTGQLPFACHAYRKWEYETFWRKYLLP